MQANILKGHGRDHTGNIFVSFHGMSADAVADLLHKLALLTTNSLEQLRVPSRLVWKLAERRVSSGR